MGNSFTTQRVTGAISILQINFLEPEVIEGVQITNWNHEEYIRNSSGLWPHLYVRGVYQFNVSYRPHMDTSVNKTYLFKQVSKYIELSTLSQMTRLFLLNYHVKFSNN